MKIKFRKLQDTNEDYLRLTQWLNNPSVRKWYGYDDFAKSPTINDVQTKYKKKVQNAEQDNPYIIIINDTDIGYIQYYKTNEYINEENVYGIDLFIGNDDYRGRGYGQKILKEMINYILETTKAKKVIIDPHIENKAAISCYLKVGFKKLKVTNDNLIMLYKSEI